MVLEIKEFEQPALQAFIAEAPITKEHRLAKCYPVEQVDEISSVYDLVTNQKIVAGSIVGFNAGTPVRTKGEAKQAMAKLTKIAHAYHLDEEDMFKFRNPRNDEERQRIIDRTLLNTAELSEGIEDTKELIRAELTYRGRFNYEDKRDNVKIQFELERPDGNDMTSTTKWSDTANSTPLSDIEAAIAQYKLTNGNKEPDYIVMTEATYALFKRSKQVKDELYRDGLQPRIIKDGEIADLFESNGYPTLEIEKGFTTLENADGTTYDVAHLEDNKFVLHAAIMGATLSGPAAENNFAKGKFAYRVISQDPIGEKTIVGEVTLPVSKNFNGNVIVTV